MQTFSSNFIAALNESPRVLVDVYEFYLSTYVPPSSGGFDPTAAIERFSGESRTWNGLAYRREVVSRGSVNLNMGQEQNSCSLEFSNVSRYMATLNQSRVLEGCYVVIRTIAKLAGVFVTDDSKVLFTGKLGKPSTINKGRFSIEARQDFGNIVQEAPYSKFVADDPNGRLPSDPLFEGFRFHALTGAFTYDTKEPSTSFLGAILGRKKTKHHTDQWSSLDNTPYGNPVPEVFGSCQMQAIPMAWKDTGAWLEGLWVWCKGPINGIDNLTVKTEKFYGLFDVQHHTGEIGGTGAAIVRNGLVPQTGGNTTEDFRFPGSGLFSLTAFTGVSFLQGIANAPEVINTPPTLVALIRGHSIDLPNPSGVYSLLGWSDNPVHQARFIHTSPRFMNINPGFMEDSINYLTGLHCDGPVIDDSEDQIIIIPSPDINEAGTSFQRYLSTGLYTPTYFLYNHLGDLSVIPEVQDGPYVSYSLASIPIDPGECPNGYHRDPVSGVCVANGPSTSLTASQPLLRKRYVASFPITDTVRTPDLLYKTLYPAAKLFSRVTKNGKIAILSEQASDSTRVRAASAVGDTSIKVLDVTPWKTGPDLLAGRLLIGHTLTTSEVRDVSSAVYSADGNAITLAASVTGTNTLTASGATFTGGSTTVRASGTLTVAGTPAPGNVLTATIKGLAISYILTTDDTNSTAAAMLCAYINATKRLSSFVSAVWDSGSPTVITLSAKYGLLNLSSALLKAHSVGVVDPVTAPTVAAAGSGALAAGIYKVAYIDVTSIGQTAPTAQASVTLTINQKINASSLLAFPTGVTSRQFFISDSPGSTTLRYVVTRVDAADFSINTLPLPEAARLPTENTTAEELIRVAMSLATNSQDILPAWRPSITVVLNDIYLPDDLNGHKYKAAAITTGTTSSSAPTWPTTAGGTVVDGGVTWTEFGETVLGQAGLTRANVIKDSYNWPLGSEQSSINQIKGSFRDRKNDFALTPMLVNDRAHQLQVGKTYPLEVDGSAVDSFNQWNRISNFLLAKYRDGDWFITLATRDLKYALGLEEGDVICSSDDSGGLINVATRVEQLSISQKWEVTIGRARLYSTNMFSDDAEKHTIPIPTSLRYVGLVNSIIEFIDNFAIRDSDALVPGFYVAVSRDLTVDGEWRGWILYADYGDGYLEIARNDIPAIMGTCTTILGTVANPTVFDTIQTFTADATTDIITCTGNQFVNGNSVRVSNSGGALPAPLVAGTVYFVRDKSGVTFKLAATSGGAAINLTTNGTGTNSVRNVLSFTLKFGPPFPAPNAFANATEAELMANPYRNLFVIGDEYLQAGTIVDNGDQSFTISDFLRGRFETDTADYLVHGASERIVFLNGAEVFVPIDVSRLNVAYAYKAVTINQNVADADVVSFTWRGNNLRPRKMRNAVAFKDGSEDWLIEAEGNPRPLDGAPEYACEVWTDATRADPADIKRTLQMVIGTTKAAMLLAYSSVVGEIDGDLGVAWTSDYTFKNNFIPGEFGGTATTMQKIVGTYQRFDFSMKSGSNDGGVSISRFVVALQTLSDELAFAEGAHNIPLDFNNCPLSVEWTIEVDTLAGSVRETYRHYNTVIAIREDADPGFGGFAIVDHEAVETGRPGPRYSFVLSGNELIVYKNFNPAGGNIPIAKVSLNPIPYPLRLTMDTLDQNVLVRSVVYGGATIPGTIYARREQVEDFGTPQSTLYLRLYQKSRVPGITGVPLDLVVP